MKSAPSKTLTFQIPSSFLFRPRPYQTINFASPSLWTSLRNVFCALSQLTTWPDKGKHFCTLTRVSRGRMYSSKELVLMADISGQGETLWAKRHSSSFQPYANAFPISSRTNLYCQESQFSLGCSLLSSRTLNEGNLVGIFPSSRKQQTTFLNICTAIPVKLK